MLQKASLIKESVEPNTFIKKCLPEVVVGHPMADAKIGRIKRFTKATTAYKADIRRILNMP